MKADYHVHTDFSTDSVYPMEDVVLKAIELKLNEICFTDHCDYITGDFTQVVDYPVYYAEFLRLKEKYKDIITLKLGIEFGIQKHMIDYYTHDFGILPFDFVLLSIHQIEDLEFCDREITYQMGRKQADINRSYFEEIDQVICNYKQYSCLSHLDLFKRYDPDGEYPDVHNEQLIKKILKQAISDGKGIEVNTSSFRYGLSDLTPSRTILKWYLELGGKIITIGSDSHQEAHLYAHIDEVKAILKEIGFSEFCTFEKMKPIFHKL